MKTEKNILIAFILNLAFSMMAGLALEEDDIEYAKFLSEKTLNMKLYL